MENIRSTLLSPAVLVARARYRKLHQQNQQAEHHQRRILAGLLERAGATDFGRAHDFARLRSYEDFREAVPVRTREKLADAWWPRIYDGEPDVCWPGRPACLIATGGTTTGPKLIPTTREQLAGLRRGALDAALLFMAHRGDARLLAGKQLMLGGSWAGDDGPGELRVFKASGVGPASAPAWFRHLFAAPSLEVNLIEDFDRKMDAITEECIGQPITFVAATPVWLLALFERVGARLGLGPDQNLRQVWPSLQTCLFSGAAVGAYEATFRRWLGALPLWEMYAASEASFALMDDPAADGLLVLAGSSFFLEFIPLAEYGTSQARRLPLWEVTAGVEYAVVLSNPSGLFAYDIGDTVRFTSVAPYRLVVTGRTAFYLNTVGEHISCGEVDHTMAEAQRLSGARVRDYTVGPCTPVPGRPPGHQWLVEFERLPSDLDRFVDHLDTALRACSSDYSWFRSARALQRPELVVAPRGAFMAWVAAHRGSDPQVKVPRASSERRMLDQVLALMAARGFTRAEVWDGEGVGPC